MKLHQRTLAQRIFAQRTAPALLLGCLLLLPACSPAGGGSGQSASAQAASGTTSTSGSSLDIRFAPDSAPIRKDAPVRLTARVTKNGTPVKDANVAFEIWKEDDEGNSRFQQEAKWDGKEAYELKGSFVEKGSYMAIVHVTTKAEHEMASSEFTVE